MLKRAAPARAVPPCGVRGRSRARPTRPAIRSCASSSWPTFPQSLSLDPLHTFTSFESQFYTAIYEGLVVADPLTLEPVPGVASELGVQRRREDLDLHPAPRRRCTPTATRCAPRTSSTSWMRMIDPANNAEYSFLFDVIKGAHAYRTGAEKDPATVGIKARLRRRAAGGAGEPGRALPEAPHPHQLSPPPSFACGLHRLGERAPP